MEIEFIRIFVKIVQNGSFSRAAEILQLPKSTVSKALTRLENETGTKLLVRTTRSLTLTAAGRAFYENCMGPIQTLEEAQKSLYGADSILTGVVRLTAPEDLGNYVIAGAAGELSRKHGGLNFELIYTNEVVDLVKDGFDFAVRLGKLRESSLKAKKIGDLYLVLVASPAYLKNKEPIRKPQDLEKHCCLSILETSRAWALQSKRGGTVNVDVKPRIRCNQMSSLMTAALAGAGVAFIPNYLCKSAIESGKLVRVLSEWQAPSRNVSLVSPLSSANSGRLKIVGDHIVEAIRKALILE